MSTISFNQTIDNVSPLITYAPPGAWTEGSAAADPLASSYSSGTFTLCTTNGASASFIFNGTQVFVGGAKRGNHGPYSVTLDGTKSTFEGASVREIFGLLYASPVLSAGQHTISITNELVDNNKPFLDIDFAHYMDVNCWAKWHYIDRGGHERQLGILSGHVLEHGLDIQQAYGIHVTLTAGASATLSFKGSHVQVFGPTGPTISRYTVKLDGQLTGTYNGTKANYNAQTPLFAANALPGGLHTLEFISEPAVSGQMLAIDFATVPGDLSSSSSSKSDAPASTSPAADSSSKGSSVGPAVGGAIGGIAVIAILGFLFFCMMKRRKQRKRDENSNGFGDKYSGTGSIPPQSNYHLTTISGSLTNPYSSAGSEAQLMPPHSQYYPGSQYQPSVHGSQYQPSHHDSVHSWNQQVQQQAPPPPALPPPIGENRRTFYTVNNEDVRSEAGGSSLGRSSTTQSAGAAGLGAGAYRSKQEHLAMPATANVPLPADASRMQVPGREQDFGPVPQSPGDYGGMLPPDYNQATEPYRPAAEQQHRRMESSVTSNAYGGYMSEASSPTRSQFSYSRSQR
ncbi:hypothetical protein MKEN_01128700 [Mycena kentingensis (nom. inval.)]|nr:hypothetical protein MKEN_01128700 [Mycena kentingensis (nom. inval.)]